MMSGYADARVRCTETGVTLRGYFIPWGIKKIPYSSIRQVSCVEMSALRGRARIWGTANPVLWANFDPDRPSKKIALVLDLGKRIKPYVTPDHPDVVEALIRERANLGPATDATTRGPLI
jgi:hypothetical protein